MTKKGPQKKLIIIIGNGGYIFIHQCHNPPLPSLHPTKVKQGARPSKQEKIKKHTFTRYGDKLKTHKPKETRRVVHFQLASWPIM
jgi:hypothetical protein